MTVRLVILAFLLTTPAAAQAPGPYDEAAATITAGDLRSRIEILAHDSMMGRGTPSPGLERAAKYVIAEFRRLGLRPAGEAGSYVQRWGLSRWRVDTTASSLDLTAPPERRRPGFASDVRLIAGAVTGAPITGDAVLLAGELPRSVATLPSVRGGIVLLAPDFRGGLSPDLGDRVEELAKVARAVILLSNRDSSTFASRLEASLEPRWTPDFRMAERGAPVIEVREGALGKLPAASGIDLLRLRTLRRTLVRPLPELTVHLILVRDNLERATAPNLIAVLDGRDRRLRDEYVAISAHVDHIGVRSTGADSIFNGADDNASGLAALLEMADAFSRPGQRPARSLMFLVPSGEEKGLWGSAYYVNHPTLPLKNIVADLNMDLIGRNWRDSVIVTGPEMTTLGETLRQVTAAHPELQMAPLADRWPQERIFYRSDHYHFAVKGVPVLFFTSGTHPDYHQPTDVAGLIDTEKASRLARLVFYLGATVADAAEAPRWYPGKHRQLVEAR